MEIKFNNVSYTYKKVNYKPKAILDKININFKIGEISGITGSIGSGKTTILELLNKTIAPNSGTITLSNKELNNKSISLVYENPKNNFICNTVLQELGTYIILKDYSDPSDTRIIDSLLMVGLGKQYLNRDPKTLSSSEQKLLSFSCALITNPKILLLDEPTYDLDYSKKIHLIKLLKLLKKRYNKTIIISSKDTEFLNALCDSIYVVNNKKIVLQGTKYNVFKEYEVLNKLGITQPCTIRFSSTVLNKKNIKIGYRDEINDLIKDIYRYK